MPKQTKQTNQVKQINQVKQTNKAKRIIKIPSKFDGYETSFTKFASPKEKRKKIRDEIKSKHGVTKERHTFFSTPRKKKNANAMDVDSPKVQEQLLNDLGIDNMQPEDYISSPLDKPELVSVKPVNLLQKHNGRGLVARTFIPAGTCLGLYTGELFMSQEEFSEYFENNPQADNSYTMKVGGKFVDAVKKGNFTRYANFSDTQNNAKFQRGTFQQKVVAKVVTTKDIQPGTSILIDYSEYSEETSKVYFFLNPEDGEMSAQQLHEDNSKHYTPMYILMNIKIFNLRKNDKLYATEVGEVVLENRSLLELDEDSLDASTFDFPYLKRSKDGAILDFDKADAFTPLMYACFNGQLDNVCWLVNHGVNINRQQNHSGNCPLFLALEGYAQAATEEKMVYINILQILIRKGANTLAHDREDKTFVHQAISILSDEDFKLIMTLISKQNEIFADLFNHLDKDNLDIVLRCIKNEEIAKVKILLDLYPTYFASQFVHVSQSNKKIAIEEFQLAIEDLSADNKAELIEVLNATEYKVPKYLLKELAVMSTASASMNC